MKKTYHLCLSSDDEVMFRDLEDYNRGFNCFALALYMTDSTGLVESDQMGWVQHMNSLRAQAEEIVTAELITS